MNKSTVTQAFHTCGYRKCSPCRVQGYEATEINFVCAYLDRVASIGKLNAVFVDVGAHVGLWALSLSEWYRNRYNIVPTIYALEPDMDNYVQLRRNAQQALTGIVPIQVAAWNRREWLVLQRHDNPGRHQVVSGTPKNLLERIQGVALDDVAWTKKMRQMDAIKIDVEGAELNVLNGACQILTDNEQLLVMIEYSISHFQKYGYTPAQLTAFMQQHDYRPVRSVDNRTIKNISAGEIKRVMFVKGDTA